ncbi:MAG: phosphoribosyltransferase family protein [Pyrinomonadaceae bacterium]
MSDRKAAASSHNRNESPKHVSRFANLRDGGRQLAEELSSDADLKDPIVLAIARGGVPAGREVATLLRLTFDMLLIRRLLVPRGPGSELCAVSVGGTMVIDEEVTIPTSPSTAVEHFLADAMAEFRHRQELFRAGRAPIELANREVLLVDSAVHGGSTMKIAIQAVRKLNPTRVIAAVPVASREGYALIESLVDRVVCLAQPEPFGHAGMWYKDFSRPADEDMHEMFDS